MRWDVWFTSIAIVPEAKVPRCILIMCPARVLGASHWAQVPILPALDPMALQGVQNLWARVY